MARALRIPLLLSVLLGSALVLSACSDDREADADTDPTSTATASADATEEPTEAAGGEASSVAVSLTDFAIAVDPASAGAGEVTFETSNDGAVPHQITVIRTDEAADALPVEGAVVDTSALEVAGEIEEFAAGGSESGTFDLASGRYVLICNVAGHYTLGMVTEFTVE